MNSGNNIHVAIPAMNEAEFLPTVLECLFNQQLVSHELHVWICVNQPDQWWDDPSRRSTCLNNQQTLSFLHQLKHQTGHGRSLHVIDRSSRGKGWEGKGQGVGMARKLLMDRIAQETLAASKKQGVYPNDGKQDLIVSLDADTTFEPAYLQSVARLFQTHPTAIALSNPYYHRLSGEEDLDRAMLRYEIYMRHYAINMWRIGSPYSFTALGSAITLPVRHYLRIGGMTAKKSGEDFYLLQKLRKTGWIMNYNAEKVFPGNRYSDRVFFGTGPALIKGSKGDWSSYPIYDHRLFDLVGQTYQLFPALYETNLKTPMTEFLSRQFRCTDVFEALRENAASRGQFVKACHHKVDALRVLQFLKSAQSAIPHSDEENLKGSLKACYPAFFTPAAARREGLSGGLKAPGPGRFLSDGNEWRDLDFGKTSIGFMDNIRNFLMEREADYQQSDLKNGSC